MWKIMRTHFWTYFAEMFIRHPSRKVEKPVGHKDLDFNGEVWTENVFLVPSSYRWHLKP